MANYKVYILYSQKADKFYIGQTNNLNFRIQQHNSPKAGYTKPYQPWKIIYTETFSSRAEAMKKENYLKSLKNKKRIQQYVISRGREVVSREAHNL